MPARTARATYSCTECGEQQTKWVGRCPGCQAWGTIVESAPITAPTSGNQVVRVGEVRVRAQRVADISAVDAEHLPTGIGEFDRVLGGGLVPGASILIAGEPGVGKSTLLLDVANRYAGTHTVLIASGEETASQIKLRADRIGADADSLYIVSETDLTVVLGHIEQLKPDLVIVDSVQAIADPGVDGRAGGITQTMRVASVLTAVAKTRGCTMLLVGQYTKAGEAAGSNSLIHLVDAVIVAEGDKNSRLRLLRGIKNRFGPADEVACFEHTDTGIHEVTDPSGLFTDLHDEPPVGSCMTINLDGRRPLLAELQALVNTAVTEKPRRGFSGLDTARMNLVLAVLESRAGVRLGTRDAYLSTVGGLRIADPGVDLPAALAAASAAREVPLPPGIAAVAEVGLSGVLRPVAGMTERLKEATRVGLTSVVIAKNQTVPAATPGLHLIKVATLPEAIQAVGLTRQR